MISIIVYYQYYLYHIITIDKRTSVNSTHIVMSLLTPNTNSIVFDEILFVHKNIMIYKHNNIIQALQMLFIYFFKCLVNSKLF